MLVCDTTPPGFVAVGVDAPSVMVKIGVVVARYWIVDATPPAGRPVPEMLRISTQFISPPDGFAMHCTTALPTMTSPSIVEVAIPNPL